MRRWCRCATSSDPGANRESLADRTTPLPGLALIQPPRPAPPSLPKVLLTLRSPSLEAHTMRLFRAVMIVSAW